MKTFKLSLISLVILNLIPNAQALHFSFEKNDKLPIVNISIAFRAGSASDPESLPGLTNFMGEMLMRGTRLRTKTQLETKLDDLGSSLAIDTRTELLIFRGSVLAENLNAYLDLLREMILEPRFDEKEIEKMRSEFNASLLAERSNDSALANRAFERLLLSGHPYGHSPVGTVSSIKKMTKKSILDQYQKDIRGGDLIVVGTGAANPSVIESWANALIAKLPAGSPQVQIPTPKNPTQTQLLIVDKPDRNQNPILAGHVGITMKDPQYFAFYLGNFGFGGRSFSARLMKEIRDKRGWAYGAFSSFNAGSQPKQWLMSFSPKTENLEQSLAFSLQMLKDLKESGLTQEEFDFAKRSIVNSSGFMYNTPAKRVENTIIEEALDLPAGFFQSYGPKIETLTLEEVNQALKNKIHPRSLAIVVVGTANQIKPLVSMATEIKESDIQVKPFTED